MYSGICQRIFPRYPVPGFQAILMIALLRRPVTTCAAILPGSAIADVERQALQRVHHGLDIVDRLRTRAFFALASGQPVAGACRGVTPGRAGRRDPAGAHDLLDPRSGGPAGGWSWIP